MNTTIRDHPLPKNKRRMPSPLQNVKFTILRKSIIELPLSILKIKVPNILHLFPLLILATKNGHPVTVTDDGGAGSGRGLLVSVDFEEVPAFFVENVHKQVITAAQPAHIPPKHHKTILKHTDSMLVPHSRLHATLQTFIVIIQNTYSLLKFPSREGQIENEHLVIDGAVGPIATVDV
jgi:hypothetical protein